MKHFNWSIALCLFIVAQLVPLHAISASQPSALEQELTVKEAYLLGLKRAKEWHQGAALHLITSVDVEPKGSYGNKGKRSTWNLIFSVPNTVHTCIISIKNRQITSFNVVKETMKAEEAIYPDDIKVDSREIIGKAKRDFRLKPGVDWATGYHFSLLKEEKYIFFEVVGLNQQNQFTKIYYNAKTGDYLGMVIKN